MDFDTTVQMHMFMTLFCFIIIATRTENSLSYIFPGKVNPHCAILSMIHALLAIIAVNC